MIVEIAVVPSKTAFGLDQLRRSYKTDSTAEAMALTPVIGTPDGAFSFMFLVRADINETAATSTEVDLTFAGCLKDDGSGNPLLPDQKLDYDNAVQSVSSSKSRSGLLLTSPATLQYYAPSRILSYMSFGGPGTLFASDPTADPVIITLTSGDTTLAPGTEVQTIVDNMFTLTVVNTFSSTEVVPGQYWQNQSRKTKIYSPWIFAITSGAYISLYSPGNGYTVGDTLTITSGSESATIVVDVVGGVLGGSGIMTWHVTANTFTTAHNMLMATGGSGTGAGFNVFIIP